MTAKAKMSAGVVLSGPTRVMVYIKLSATDKCGNAALRTLLSHMV